MDVNRTSSTRRWGLPIVVLALVAAAGCSSDDPIGPVSEDQLLRVEADGSGDFDSVAAAVQAAGPGSVIRIGPGTFDGRIVVSRGVQVIGSGPTTVLSAPGTVQSFPDDVGDDDRAVVEIRGTSGVVIRDLLVRGPVDGIVVRDSSDVSLINVVSSGNGDEGVDVRSSVDVTITGDFSNNGDHGVQARDGASAVSVSSSTVRGNVSRGVRFRDSTGCTLSASEVAANGDDGVLVRDSSGASVVDNTITGNDGWGIRTVNAADTTIMNNTLSGNREGDVRQE